jgi:hypothetical protein
MIKQSMLITGNRIKYDQFWKLSLNGVDEARGKSNPGLKSRLQIPSLLHTINRNNTSLG